MSSYDDGFRAGMFTVTRDVQRVLWREYERSSILGSLEELAVTSALSNVAFSLQVKGILVDVPPLPPDRGGRIVATGQRGAGLPPR